jgi:hypothetical protein
MRMMRGPDTAPPLTEPEHAMQTALHTWSFRDRFAHEAGFDIFRALDLAAELGFRGVEVMAGKAGSPPDDLGSDDPAHLRKTIREFEQVSATLSTREQEELIKLLVSKVVYDGVTGKVTVSFRSAGAKELCQGKAE